MRLIDADSLKGLYEGFGEYEDNLVVPIKVVLKNIDDIPTAYDLDGVLDRLKQNAVEFELFGICSDYVPLGRAIEIVKGGAE